MTLESLTKAINRVWSRISHAESSIYIQNSAEFRRFNTELLGISVEGNWLHLAFSKDRNLYFPLLLDFELKGEVVRKDGI